MVITLYFMTPAMYERFYLILVLIDNYKGTNMKVTHQVKIFQLLSTLFAGSVLLSCAASSDEPKLNESIGSDRIVFIPPVPGKRPVFEDDKPDMDLPPGVVFQSSEEAFDTDNGLLAEILGLPRERVEKAILFQNAFDEYTRKLYARYPEKIAGTWVEPVPATVGKIRFVGEVPLEVSAEVEKRGQGEQIVLIGGSTMLEADHHRRTSLVAQTLFDLKLINFSCSYNIFQDVIDVEILDSNETMPLNKADIIEAVRSRVQQSMQPLYLIRMILNSRYLKELEKNNHPSLSG